MNDAQIAEIVEQLTTAITVVQADMPNSAVIHAGQATLLLRRVLEAERIERQRQVKLDPAYDPEKVSDDELSDRQAERERRVYGGEE